MGSLTSATLTPTPSPSPTVSLSTPTPTTLSTLVASVSSTPVTSISSSSYGAFVGYESVGMVDLTTVYSSANCAASSIFYSSSDWATCCSDPCTLYTGCLSQTILQGPAGNQTCSGTATCHMDFIYQSSAVFEAPLTAYYCDDSLATPISFYRAQPTDGIVSSNTSAINGAKQAQSSNPFGLGLGSGLGAFAFLLAIGVFVWICRSCLGCCGGSGGRPSNSYRPGNAISSRDRYRQERDEYYSGQAEDVRIRQQYDFQMRQQNDYDRQMQQQQDDQDRRLQQQQDDYNNNNNYNNNNY